MDVNSFFHTSGVNAILKSVTLNDFLRLLVFFSSFTTLFRSFWSCLVPCLSFVESSCNPSCVARSQTFLTETRAQSGPSTPRLISCLMLFSKYDLITRFRLSFRFISKRFGPHFCSDFAGPGLYCSRYSRSRPHCSSSSWPHSHISAWELSTRVFSSAGCSSFSLNIRR